ncbi:MAG: DNA-directed RNA polymerase subunit omega [Candidatus Omnitrophica bacterium 4484_70.2]|nr:MAG: DNA-directed RNA polymerase subunit omega [Candidatus Omnitrophica bacterium 4484_70.2]
MEEDYFPLEKLIEGANGSIYKLTILAAKRALQLVDGDKPLIDKPDSKPLENALREVAEKKIRVKEKKNS